MQIVFVVDVIVAQVVDAAVRLILVSLILPEPVVPAAVTASPSPIFLLKLELRATSVSMALKERNFHGRL